MLHCCGVIHAGIVTGMTPPLSITFKLCSRLDVLLPRLVAPVPSGSWGSLLHPWGMLVSPGRLAPPCHSPSSPAHNVDTFTDANVLERQMLPTELGMCQLSVSMFFPRQTPSFCCI